MKLHQPEIVFCDEITLSVDDGRVEAVTCLDSWQGYCCGLPWHPCIQVGMVRSGWVKNY